PVTWGDKLLPENTPPKIELLNARFQYGEDGFAINDINVTIKPYEHVAIVGKTGAGKSTVLHLLAGLVPATEGEFFINGIHRNAYDEKSWFNELSYISQHPYLFSGTIQENIAIGGREGATMSEIIAAAKK